MVSRKGRVLYLRHVDRVLKVCFPLLGGFDIVVVWGGPWFTEEFCRGGEGPCT